jgi:glycosyltransferase involved in cell wall biosynthesis
MKIVLIGTLYPPYSVGGAEKAIAMLAEALVRYGHNVVVVTLHPGVRETIEEREGIRIYRLPLDNLYWPFSPAKPKTLLRLVWHLRDMWNGKAARRIGRILDRETPDVVHTHNISGFSVSIWRAVKLRRIRLVHTLHDYYLLCSRATLYRRGGSCESRCRGCQLLTANRKVASTMPDEIVSVSQFTLERHKRLGFFHNVPSRVIYNIQPTNEGKTPERITNTRPDELVFGFIGRIGPEKGIETMLQATQYLVPSGWRLKIAGNGTDAYVKYLRERYSDERIEWLGFTTASEFYSMVDVVVIPSEWEEPLAYVCLESLHRGKAIICAEAGGLPEIARLSTIVEYFQPRSVEQLSRLMNGALDDRVRWKGNLPPTSATLEPFTEEAVVGKYISAYRRGVRAELQGADGRNRVSNLSTTN